MNCDVTSTIGYRETMFNMLPQLKYLDNTDREGGKSDECFPSFNIFEFIFFV